MKRDFDLIRHIMTDIENMPAASAFKSFEYPGYDKATIHQHIKLLIDENLIEGKIHESHHGIDAVRITGLTWNGHDFIDASKDESIWTKAKETVLKPTVSITFSILLEWLKEEAKKKLGLS